jgi:hypothetical protein
MSKIRYLIYTGEAYVSFPAGHDPQIELTDRIADALKFVTYERAQSVAMSIKDRLKSAPIIVAKELSY